MVYCEGGLCNFVAGTRPPPYSWEKWNLKLLEPSNIRELQDDRTQSLKGKPCRLQLSFSIKRIDLLSTLLKTEAKTGRS